MPIILRRGARVRLFLAIALLLYLLYMVKTRHDAMERASEQPVPLATPAASAAPSVSH